MLPRLERDEAGGDEGGGGDAGLHVRDVPPAGRHQVGGGDLQQAGPGVLQVLAADQEQLQSVNN